MVPPKPRKGTAPTLEGVIAQSLKDHRGRLLMDCRWYCVCGFTSERLGEGTNHADWAHACGRTHQAEHIALALADQVQREQEEETA